jgi:hypothetical protein
VSIEPERDQYFQYATFGVIGLILVVCACYGLLFLNPAVNPILALRPATATRLVSVIEFPATWTPTSTRTPTDTPTEAPTDTPTDTPTNTPIPSNTPLPTATFTQVPPPPTAKPFPRPVYHSPTPLPTAPPASNSFVVVKGETSCSPDGTWFIEGTVWANGYGNGFVPGTRVRLWIDGAGYQDAIAGATGKNSPGYYEFIFPKHTQGNGRIGIVDDSGNLLTPGRYAVKLTKNCTGAGVVNEIIIDFTRQ